MGALREPVLIVTDAARRDLGAVSDFELDLAFGEDEQDFEASFDEPVLSGGELVYLDGTEYGGIVDEVCGDTASTTTTYRGRTWHGILEGKVIRPDAGQDYLTLTGDLNRCIAALVSRMGLSGLFSARASACGISASGYRPERYCQGYTGLRRLCRDHGAKLMMSRHDGSIEIWAERAETHSDELDSDLMDFGTTAMARCVNHLVCLGQGELRNRVVVDLYADSRGRISQTQTLEGADERAEVYDYTSADRATLVEEGTKRLRELQTGGSVTVEVDSSHDWHVGDWVEGRDNRLGTVVTAEIAKKVVKVSSGVLTASYEVADGARLSTFDVRREYGAAIAAAASVAGIAEAHAAAKRRVFTSQPTPPYDVGDLWVMSDAEGGVDIMVCTTAKGE